MSRCPSCGNPVERFQEACPVCSLPSDLSNDRFKSHASVKAPSDATTDDDESMVTVARFANAAEAGYFAEELSHFGGIPTLLRSDKTFNALSGYWSQRFDLLVPEADLSEAEATLRQLIEQTGGSETLSEDLAANLALQNESPTPHERFEIEPARPEHSPEESRVNWIPIVLTLTAGTIAFWAARRIHDGDGNGHPPAPAKLSTTELWNRLSAAPQPWRQTLSNGQGIRELHFDSARQRAVLREDADGDGFFEHEELLQRTIPK